eukprot:6062150-Amphidinium_carterae.1
MPFALEVSRNVTNTSEGNHMYVFFEEGRGDGRAPQTISCTSISFSENSSNCQWNCKGIVTSLQIL